jgi:GT2 family glycosyltransferase
VKPVSVVIPVFDARALLEQNLPALLAELEGRGLGDEVIVVDDAGERGLAAWLESAFPPPATFDRARTDVRVLRRKKNAGPARAALDGAEAAVHERVLLLAPDVRVRPGFLAPLEAALEDPAVVAASPCVHRAKDPDGAGFARVVWRGGFLSLEAADAGRGAHVEGSCADGSALLARRADLIEAGFDARFTPGGFEDVDLTWCWKRAGRRVVVVPQAHVDAGDGEGTGVPDPVRGIARERNLLLLTWKHLDDQERRREHVEALEARALDALLGGRRDELVTLALALG